MKKLFTFIVLLFIPFMINAKEYCKVVSGDVNTIGSEIACGEEYFYVVESNENSVKMLSKYNVEAGNEYDKIVVSESRFEELVTLCNGAIYLDSCQLLGNEPEFKDYHFLYGYDDVEKENGEIEYHLLVGRYIHNGEIKQNSKAIGAHGDEHGNPDFPEYGVVRLYPQFMDTEYLNNHIYENGLFADFNPSDVELQYVSEDEILYIDDYKKYLNEKGYNVTSVDMLSLADMNSLVKKITGAELPLEEWYQKDWENKQGFYGGNFWVIGSIKEQLPEKKYDWLFNTTYWLKTVGTNPTIRDQISGQYIFFVDTLGSLCSADACTLAIGAGIRPVVEISKTDIIYNITPETDGNGTLDVPKTAEEGEIITYKVEPKDGYELDEMVIIMTKTNKEIEITTDDVTCDENKVCTIKPEKFKMPAEDIIVRVKFVNILFNPKTGNKGVSGILFTMLLIFISGIVIFKSYNKGFRL